MHGQKHRSGVTGCFTSPPQTGGRRGGGKAESDHWGRIIHFHGFQWLFLGTHGPFDSHDLVISKRRPYFSLLLALPRALSSLKHQHGLQSHRAGAGGEGGAGSWLHNQPALAPAIKHPPRRHGSSAAFAVTEENMMSSEIFVGREISKPPRSTVMSEKQV